MSTHTEDNMMSDTDDQDTHANPTEDVRIPHFVKKTVLVEETVSLSPKKTKRHTSKWKKKDAVPELFGGEDPQQLAPGVGEHITDQLVEIYENDDGTMPDMTHFSTRRKKSVVTAFVVLLFACLFLGSIAWAGFFIFQPASTFSEDDVTFSMTGDEIYTVGNRVRYRIRYRNGQATALNHVVLQVRYPEGFVFVDATKSPTNDQHDEWDIGTIQGGDNGYIDIDGTMFGTFGEKQSFRVFLNYTPENFSSEFQKITSLIVDAGASPVEIVIGGDAHAVRGAEQTYTITVRAFQDIAVATPLSLAVILDDTGFRKQKSNPSSDALEPYQWTIGELIDTKEITVSGVFADTVTSSIRAHVVVFKDGVVRGDGYIIASAEQTVDFLSNDARVDLAINGSQRDVAVQPGDMLNMTVAIHNDGKEALTDVSVRLVLDAPSDGRKSIIDWAKLEDNADGSVIGEQINEQVRRGTITWTRREVKDLRQIDPGEVINLDIRVPIKNASQEDLLVYQGTLIQAVADITYGSGDIQTMVSTPIALTLNSDTILDVSDNVSSNSDGKKVHTVTWLLSNTLHELKDIEMSADLFGDITVRESDIAVPAGKITYDGGAQKHLVWRIDTMPVSVDVLGLQFPIIINKENPTQTNLTSKVTFKATDTITGQQIYHVGDEILLSQ